jgi:hypothetical protein
VRVQLHHEVRGKPHEDDLLLVRVLGGPDIQHNDNQHNDT